VTELFFGCVRALVVLVVLVGDGLKRGQEADNVLRINRLCNQQVVGGLGVRTGQWMRTSALCSWCIG
jgi:hypothetical protein